MGTQQTDIMIPSIPQVKNRLQELFKEQMVLRALLRALTCAEVETASKKKPPQNKR
jgi:hypothetical protein